MVANIQAYLKAEYGYSDFQIAQIRYALLSILSETSKLVIMGIFFYYTGNLSHYLWATIVLCTLRTATGGLHYNHYWSCLLMTFLFFFTGILLLPMLPLIMYGHIILLCLCIGINYRYAPIVSSYRPIPDGVSIQKSKMQSFIFITIYALFMFIIPENPYLTVGSWIIILQSLQLFVANLLQRRRNHETSVQS